MPETADPRAALTDADVAVRAAAARDLAAAGELGDVEVLLRYAIEDRSPSVRLYTAAATASILRRGRRSGDLPKQVVDQVLDALRRFDPQRNPSVLLALGAVGPSVRGRLGRLLKDPHSDVRLAAVATLRAEALSALSMGDADLTERVGAWASDRQLPADVRIDLGRLLGEVGHPDGEQLLVSLTAVLRDPEGVLDVARQRIAARRERTCVAGVWREQEPEVLVAPDPKAPAPWVGVTSESWFADGSHGSLTWEGPAPSGPEGAIRLLFVGIPGQPGHAVLQTRSATRFGLVDKALAGWVEHHIDQLRGMEPLCAHLRSSLQDVEGAVAPRVRALLRWRAGDAPGAAAELDELLGAKKPRADLYWWRANVALSDGDLDVARDYVQRFLGKAAKKAPLRPDAEALLATLTG